LMVALTAD
jgi:hypothetical protein